MSLHIRCTRLAGVLALAVLPAAASTMIVYPTDPGLFDTAGSVASDSQDAAPGFGTGSWQATGVKTNYYVTPQDLFGHDVLVSDVSSISYWTDSLNYLGSSNWSLYIYTRSAGAGDSQTWYRSRLFAAPGAGGAGWVEWTTGTLGFVDTNRGGPTATSSLLWSSIAAGPVTLDNGSSWNYSGETVQWFGLQTDSAARTFTGAVDGLTVTLRDEESGSVDFEAIPEPGAGLLCLPGLLALVRGRRK